MDSQFEAIVEAMLADQYAVCDEFFSPQTVAALRSNLLTAHANHRMHRAGTGRQATAQQNTEVRGDVISWLENPSTNAHEHSFFETVEAFYRYLNRTCYTGVNGSEFHYAMYEPGSFYRRHLDRFRHDSGRQFSMITYLNDDWKEADGGELVLYLDGGEKTIRVKSGRTVFFKADEIEHEVKTAHRQRLSIAGWLLNVQM